MRVSVVICTLNRAASLRSTLECLRHQSHDEFEVVVVNGPSTDDTDEVVAAYGEMVRYERCPVPNLSVSRNIGIRAAGGEIVAFIDDDALPEFDWLRQALPAFNSEEVAGVGGIVFDHTGLQLQYRYSAANRFGEAISSDQQPFDDQCAPGSFQFPYLQGTNALFRRDALLRVGGFDETFDYYLDETDLCCRLVDAGYTLRQLPDAPVHHKFLPSNIRDHHRVVTNWFPIVKNQVYFSYRHASEAFSEYDISEHTQQFVHRWVDDAQSHEMAGRLPPGSAALAVVCAQAVLTGTELGLKRRGERIGAVRWPAPEFRAFPTVAQDHRRKITFLSTGYRGNMTGGIARFISELAPALARRGHEVRVITRATDVAAVDLEDGVWVHRIEVPAAGASGVAPETFGHINDFTTATVAELERISTWVPQDLVYGPMWDVEVLGALDWTCLPVVVQVATPMAVAGQMAGMREDPGSAAAINRLMALETRVLDEGDLFHANSAAVERTIVEHYGDRIDPTRWGVVHLGVVDSASPGPTPSDSDLRVLFVGRFELRKGIDVYLAAVEALAPRHPNVRFVAAGEDRPLRGGEEPFGEQWAHRHASAPWIDRVVFEGSVDDARLHALYASADVVVLPSRYESFGLVMVEAMMHGRALVSGDTSGVREVVRNGVDGVLVEPGDVQATISAIDALLHDAAVRAQLGDAGRKRYLDEFHIDRFAERFERFLGRVGRIQPSSSPGPGHCVLSEGDQAITPVRSRFGGTCIRLAAGASVTVTLDPGTHVRLLLDADLPSTVEISDRCSSDASDGGGGRRTLEVPPDRMSRVGVDARARECTVAIVTGEVRMHGFIEVRGEAT